MEFMDRLALTFNLTSSGFQLPERCQPHAFFPFAARHSQEHSYSPEVFTTNPTILPQVARTWYSPKRLTPLGPILPLSLTRFCMAEPIPFPFDGPDRFCSVVSCPTLPMILPFFDLPRFAYFLATIEI